MGARFYCDVCNYEIGNAEELGESSVISIRTSEGPLAVVMTYGYGRPQDNTFRPNSGCVCQRCILLQLREDLDDQEDANANAYVAGMIKPEAG